MNQKWAENGEKVDPDTIIPNKIDIGWTKEIPPLSFFNYIQNAIANQSDYLNIIGIPEWSSNVSYKTNSWARGGSGAVYYSFIDNNIGNDPTSSPEYWAPISQDKNIGDNLKSYDTQENLEARGYLLQDGREVSRETYSVLFNLIGTSFGAGDGSTTFNLPDQYHYEKLAEVTGPSLASINKSLFFVGDSFVSISDSYSGGTNDKARLISVATGSSASDPVQFIGQGIPNTEPSASSKLESIIYYDKKYYAFVRNNPEVASDGIYSIAIDATESTQWEYEVNFPSAAPPGAIATQVTFNCPFTLQILAAFDGKLLTLWGNVDTWGNPNPNPLNGINYNINGLFTFGRYEQNQSPLPNNPYPDYYFIADGGKRVLKSVGKNPANEILLIDTSYGTTLVDTIVTDVSGTYWISEFPNNRQGFIYLTPDGLTVTKLYERSSVGIAKSGLTIKDQILYVADMLDGTPAVTTYTKINIINGAPLYVKAL